MENKVAITILKGREKSDEQLSVEDYIKRERNH